MAAKRKLRQLEGCLGSLFDSSDPFCAICRDREDCEKACSDNVTWEGSEMVRNKYPTVFIEGWDKHRLHYMHTLSTDPSMFCADMAYTVSPIIIHPNNDPIFLEVFQWLDNKVDVNGLITARQIQHHFYIDLQLQFREATVAALRLIAVLIEEKVLTPHLLAIPKGLHHLSFQRDTEESSESQPANIQVGVKSDPMKCALEKLKHRVKRKKSLLKH